MTAPTSPGDGQSRSADDIAVSLQNIGAEHALLGALFINNRAYDHVSGVVERGDFVNDVHGRIYEAIGTLIEQGLEASPVTLWNVFKDDGALAALGGAKYLARLAESAVTVINAPHYARTIADLARRRDVIFAAQDIIADAATVAADRDAAAVIDDAEQRLYEIAERGAHRGGTPRSLADVLAATIADIETAYRRGGASTVDTGLAEVDRLVAGMGAGDLCIIAGRPAMGKTACAGSIAFNLAHAGKTVLIFSLEMTRAELAQRWIAGLTGISTDRQRHGQLRADDDWHRLIEAQHYLSGLPILVDDQPRLSVPQMRQRARRVRRRQRGLDLIIIDHLQLVRQGGRQESRRVEIGDITSSLKAIAKELGVPVLLLSQLNRGVEHRDDKRPTLADLKESSDVEQDADVVMFLYREEYYRDKGEPARRPNETAEAYSARLADWQCDSEKVRGLAEIIVAKNRHGRTGVARVHWDAERQRFENLAHGV